MVLNLLLKFGKKEHISQLRECGELYMGTFSSYRNSDNKEVRDLNEGAHRVTHEDRCLISRKNECGKLSNSIQGGKTEIHEYNELFDSARVFCMYYSTTDCNQINNLSSIVSKELVESFEYDSVAVIFDLNEFYKRLDNKLDELKAPYHRGHVNYVDLSRGDHRLTPIDKDLRFIHQKEFRICALNFVGQDAYILKIGSIEDISVQCSVDELDKINIELDLSSKQITFRKCV